MLHFLQNLVVVCAVWVLYKNHKFLYNKNGNPPTHHVHIIGIGIGHRNIDIYTGYIY